jgi:hypothetical protein
MSAQRFMMPSSNWSQSIEREAFQDRARLDSKRRRATSNQALAERRTTLAAFGVAARKPNVGEGSVATSTVSGDRCSDGHVCSRAKSGSGCRQSLPSCVGSSTPSRSWSVLQLFTMTLLLPGPLGAVCLAFVYSKSHREGLQRKSKCENGNHRTAEHRHAATG